jgi:transposase InsO family protein
LLALKHSARGTFSGGKVKRPPAWSGDITYIATDEGWLYLAAVIDLFSRQVVGWSMQPHMQASLVTQALRMAWFRRHPAPGLIFHSDRVVNTAATRSRRR